MYKVRNTALRSLPNCLQQEIWQFLLPAPRRHVLLELELLQLRLRDYFSRQEKFDVSLCGLYPWKGTKIRCMLSRPNMRWNQSMNSGSATNPRVTDRITDLRPNQGFYRVEVDNWRYWADNEALIEDLVLHLRVRGWSVQTCTIKVFFHDHIPLSRDTMLYAISQNGVVTAHTKEGSLHFTVQTPEEDARMFKV